MQLAEGRKAFSTEKNHNKTCIYLLNYLQIIHLPKKDTG
jgi:hypothetical protein